MRARALAAALAALLCAGAAGQDPAIDPARAIRSKDVAERLAAVEALRAGAEGAEKLLLGALDDKDWEVVERAAEALGERGGSKSLEPLIEVALEGPVRRMRLAAARSLARIDAEGAARELDGLAGGREAVRALEALAVVALGAEGAAGRGLEKALGSKDAPVRRAAARAFVGLEAGARGAWLERLLADPDPVVRVAALEAAAAKPEKEWLPLLAARLADPAVLDVVERRLNAALAEVALVSGEDLARPALEAAAGSIEPAVAARAMRLARELGRRGEERPLADLASGLIAKGLEHPHEAARAAALHAGAALADERALAAAPRLAEEDPSARVRLRAQRALVEARGAADPELFALLGRRLAQDADARVRERAAVALGALASPEAAELLAPALEDGDWTVAACAAVSLGLTREPAALEPLVALAGSADWRLRGAAVVGLTHTERAEAVPAVIAALEDAEPAVRRTAWTWLRRIARRDLPEEAKAWRKWWQEGGAEARFRDPEQERRRRERYGYAKSDQELFQAVYAELDVIVLESRGDHIERLLERLEIPHRLTAAARIAGDAVHPEAVYVSNCTGEIEPADVERLQWFVLTGGYLFGSCWSVRETIQRVYPGVLGKLGTGGEVVDQVPAEPVDPRSPYLEGVFPPGVQPIYELVGAHLIDVLDPERAEVLIDSPVCAARWGGGNLAAWFRAGHGLIMDSANHFDLQGLEGADGLKTAEERQAWAIDHLGLDYERWRETRGERWWGSNRKAAEHVRDHSAFRFVTNFVRHRRLAED